MLENENNVPPMPDLDQKKNAAKTIGCANGIKQKRGLYILKDGRRNDEMRCFLIIAARIVECCVFDGQRNLRYLM
jgi:hypothetical protein